MKSGSCSLSSVKGYVEEMTADYVEPVAGARARLNGALEVIVVTYYAALLKQHASHLMEGLEAAE